MDLQYLVREPATITSSTPILFMMHGYGSNEQDLFSFREDIPADWIIVSYRAPHSTPFEGYSWFDIDFNNAEKFADLAQAKESLKALLESIMQVTNHYGLIDNPTHLCGFSQGGMLAYALALQHPQLFSKVACLSTFYEENLVGEVKKDAKKVSHMRFFISHGMEDAVIPLEWGRKAADILYDLQCYFSFREYMSGHGVNQKNYIDLMTFFKS